MSLEPFEYVENGVIKFDLVAYGRWKLERQRQEEVWPRTLRELFARDPEGLQKFQDRLRDLDRRFDRWCDVDPAPIGEPA